MLQEVGAVFAKKLASIKEIQIQGHADTTPVAAPNTNLLLGAKRAINVFEYLQHNAGIDPASTLISATSFGEYMPVARLDQVDTFNADSLQNANDTPEERALNRRIEILLFYRQRNK